MAVAIPIIASFAAGASGIAAIGAATTVLGTIAGYATVAGAIMTGVGALTGKKDLMKIGGVLSLAGGLGTLASGVGNAAASSGGGLTGGGAAVDEITAEAARGAGSNAATGVVGDAAGAAASTVPVTAPQFMPMGEAAAGVGAEAPSLMQAGQLQAGQAASSVPMTAPASATGPIQDYAQGLTMNDMQSFWDRVKGVGKVIEQNPNAAKLAGQVVQGGVQAYGQYQQQQALEDQQNYQRSLMERARANLNSPIRITYGAR